MHDPNTQPIQKRATPLHVAVPTIIPLFVAFYSIQGTMLFDEHYGFNAVARLLVGWCAVRLIPWWLSAMVNFSLPSMFLDAQGNASIVI
jgi:hypothetical protein